MIIDYFFVIIIPLFLKFINCASIDPDDVFNSYCTEFFQGNRKILQNISDTLEISNKKVKAEEEHLSKIFDAFDESIKKSTKIADDESLESFIIKHQLLLFQMIKEMMTRQETTYAIVTSKDPVDCSDVLAAGVTESGFYLIYPFKGNDSNKVKVYCDMKTDGGGWTVFLQRTNALNPVNFTRNWDSYKKGFGNKEEFWLGNEVLHAMTSNRNNSLRVDTKSKEGNITWGSWNTFVVHSEEEKYNLVVKRYVAKSAAYDRFNYRNGSGFSTYDVDNDKYDKGNCAQILISGWWYDDCVSINPTGVYGKTGIKGIYIGNWSKTDNATRHATWLQLKIRPLDWQKKDKQT